MKWTVTLALAACCLIGCSSETPPSFQMPENETVVVKQPLAGSSTLIISYSFCPPERLTENRLRGNMIVRIVNQSGRQIWWYDNAAEIEPPAMVDYAKASEGTIAVTQYTSDYRHPELEGLTPFIQYAVKINDGKIVENHAAISLEGEPFDSSLAAKLTAEIKDEFAKKDAANHEIIERNLMKLRNMAVNNTVDILILLDDLHESIRTDHDYIADYIDDVELMEHIEKLNDCSCCQEWP